jgi:glyoxylase-like metal-dependent hydrolase (beta-lactamase superfamily II)
LPNKYFLNKAIRNIDFKIKVIIIKKIFLTHAHADHSGGGKFLKERLKCKVIAGTLTKKYVEKGNEQELGLDYAKRSGFYGDDYKFKTYNIDILTEDGEEMKIGESKLRAINIPGHSKDSMCYLVKKNGQNILFTGDVLNHGGKIVLLNCFGFDLKDYRENIKKLANLSIDMLFPGHGVFTIKNGQSHIDILVDAFEKLLINSQLII